MKISEIANELGLSWPAAKRYVAAGRIIFNSEGEADIELMKEIIRVRGKHINENGMEVVYSCSSCGLLMAGRVCKVSGYVRAQDDSCPFL
ncbi:MAG: hypothetical protein LC109_12450 [Bacteroidia bacterium]|nr:hypothetical protein [Bacteroidia bacterium]